MVTLRNRQFATFLTLALFSTAWGCQSNSMMSTPWNQPTRVPPPNAPSNLPTAPYSTPMGAGAGAGAGQAAPKSVSAYSNSPLTDAVAAAQNDLRIATDNARMAIEKSANSINSGVSQAGARIDRVGSGVVQASEILESSFKDPIPFPPIAVPPSTSLPATSLPSTPLPAASSGSIGDSTGEPSAEGNSQWRKPIPR